jgi:D-alanyl-D-alanine carboxypeptidase
LLILLVPLLVAFVSGCGSGTISPNGPPLPAALTRQIDQTIDAEMQSLNLPGVAVGIWIPGRGEYVTAKGKADMDTGLARDTSSRFRIASITKTFTATAVLILADEGRLSVTDKLEKWYPNFPKADQITVDHLLRMRSGIYDSAGVDLVPEYFANPTATLTAEDMIARAAAHGSESIEPDTRTVYTNVNYILLERIVEKVSGQPLGGFIHERILTPLRMSRSLYPTNDSLPGPVHGYSASRSGVLTDKTTLNPAIPGGAGAMISTLDDLRVYARALVTGTLLKPATQQTRLQGSSTDTAPAFVRYGQGIVQIGKFYGHNGTIFGFSSEMWYLPEKDAVVVINVNRLDEDDESKSSALFFKLAKILFPGDVEW